MTVTVTTSMITGSITVCAQIEINRRYQYYTIQLIKNIFCSFSVIFTTRNPTDLISRLPGFPGFTRTLHKHSICTIHTTVPVLYHYHCSPVPTQVCISRCYRHVSRQHLEGGRLAGSIHPEQTKALPLVHTQTDAIYCRMMLAMEATVCLQ